MPSPIGYGAIRAGHAGSVELFRTSSAFLRELERHNTKAWFEQNKARYRELIAEPALAFVEALGARIATFSPHVVAEPRIGGSLFRIHRDTRFSADKSPYKTHVGMRLRDRRFLNGLKCEGPIFYVEFDARTLRRGIGVKTFEPHELPAYRAALAHAPALRVLERAIARMEAEGGAIASDALARAPKGTLDLPLARYKGLFAMFESPAEEVASATLLKRTGEVFHRHVALHEWLAERIGRE